MRKRFLLSENINKGEYIARKGENATTQQKRRLYVYAFIEGKRGTENRKRAYISKTSLAKSKTFLSSENVAHKVENALTEQNRRMKRRKCVYRAETPVPSENVPRKGTNALNVRKGG